MLSQLDSVLTEHTQFIKLLDPPSAPSLHSELDFCVDNICGQVKDQIFSDMYVFFTIKTKCCDVYCCRALKLNGHRVLKSTTLWELLLLHSSASSFVSSRTFTSIRMFTQLFCSSLRLAPSASPSIYTDRNMRRNLSSLWLLDCGTNGAPTPENDTHYPTCATFLCKFLNLNFKFFLKFNSVF